MEDHKLINTGMAYAHFKGVAPLYALCVLSDHMELLREADQQGALNDVIHDLLKGETPFFEQALAQA